MMVVLVYDLIFVIDRVDDPNFFPVAVVVVELIMLITPLSVLGVEGVFKSSRVLEEFTPG